MKEQPGAFAVLLDGRPLRTPRKAALALPTGALAAAVAAEWERQGEFIRAETMPLTRLANVALDWTPAARAETIAAVAKYGETDLLCHRAEGPAALAARQASAWDPLVAWAGATLGAPLICAVGVLALNQPPQARAALKAQAEKLNDFALTGLAHAAALAGSAVIAFALQRARIDGSEAYAAAVLDEAFQLEIWGEDSEARARLDGIAAEFAALESFFAALA